MIVKISTSKIKDYLKKIIPECSKWSIGQIDENQEKMIALYANRRQLEDNSKYKIKNIWNNTNYIVVKMDKKL